MPLSEIQGQDRARAQLRSALRSGRRHHAFLITGLAGVGVPEVAARFAEALLCQRDPEGCGLCSTCDRARRGLHPDLLSVGLEEGAREVKVEAIRGLTTALQLHASEANGKVALIRDADRLNPSAQNALLKTLEEPPLHTVLILASEAEERLLPTVRSRCLRIGLRPLPEDLLAERLVASRQLDLPTATLLARLSRGSQTRAESFGGGFRERRMRLIALAKSLVEGQGTPVAALTALELAQEFSDDREKAAEALEVLIAFWRDLLVCQQPVLSASLLAPDQMEMLSALATGLSPGQVLAGLAALRDAALALDGNGGPRLQLEAAALRLGGVAP